MIYIIRKGDSLSKIASQYNTFVKGIALANNISDVNDIYIGQKIIIPDHMNNPFTIEVNKNKNILKLLKDGTVIKEYKVAVGKESTPTPEGIWKITKKALWGEQFGGTFLQLSVPHGIYGIHGTDKPWSIGKDVSNGCIRMYSEQARELYEIIPKGTSVVIY